MPKRIYPPELHTFVAEHASGTNDRDLTELINARFGNGYITEPQVKAYRSNHHLPSGLPKGRATYFSKTFCAKKPMSVYHCYDCGTDTALANNMTPVYANCECGKRSRYMTNVTEWGFDLTCVVCGAPVAVEYRPGINQYQTCGKAFVKSRKRKK